LRALVYSGLQLFAALAQSGFNLNFHYRAWQEENSRKPEGPGPLVSMMAQVTGSFPIPVVIVPGDLSDPDIDALS